MRFSPQDEEFRQRLRQWLAENLTGRFAGLRGAGGPGREHEAHAERALGLPRQTRPASPGVRT